ncbi:ATPase [Hallella multisaccharivorax DSM 17128]|uniref:N-acetylglucosamine kinase n=1 Tax=Hallella multisaccharivorax DSM 17128 TaxID=688246 RepID=F8N6C5_9BACT|nr:hypothetical protein [Hallella multisaccharivorax]EGN57230.1 N-acetylglucosamine kinase [Hallella multisaccharivorax DSM 17128]GJG31532.1 ATPase [Hallella multisaccharivorax DSM 17128]
MIMIADSGSTKTDWAFLHDDGRIVHFTSAGYNPNYVTGEYIYADIKQNVPTGINLDNINAVYFYGAGVTELQYGFIEKTMRCVFPQCATVEVAMDTLGAARALLGDDQGLVVILGTGMNSALYDGRCITMNIDSLGFILGDEGSGGYMGKRLMIDYCRHNITGRVYEMVKNEVGLNSDEVIDQIYTKPFPNRWCAKFAKFIGKHIDDDPYFAELVSSSFRNCFDKILTHYPSYQDYPINCVGSVAYYFRPMLEAVCHEYGMTIGRIMQYPIDGLVEYHKNHS